MQFHVDNDTGASIIGWIVPDNPGAVPRGFVSLNDQEPVGFEATILREDIRDLGMHRTGMVGFRIDETSCPGLSTAPDVKIWEADSHIQIYGRLISQQHAKLKLFYLDLNAVPQTRVNTLVWGRFAMQYNAVERFPFDTLYCILNNPYSHSIYATGRPFYRRYQHLLSSRGYAVVTLLCDPYEELAERLLFSRYVLSKGASPDLMQHLSGLEPILDLCEKLDLASEQSINAAFSSLTPPQELALSNPFVRALACDVGEPVQRRHVATAMDNLGAMDVVGLRSKFDAFKSILQELFGVDLMEEVQPAEASHVPEVAEKLAHNERVKLLLSHDVLLYTLAREAIGKALVTS